MVKATRLLCLQQSTVFESYGGAEYYLDDLLIAAARLLGTENVRSIVPQRTETFKISPRPYSIEIVRFKQRGLFRKIENRYGWDFFWTAYANAQDFSPTYLVCAHVSLAPLTYLISKLTKIPYFVIALGIETWGDLLPQDEWALKRANGIISISHWTKKVLVERGYDPDRVSVVHPTLNEFFEAIPLPERTPNTSGSLRLLTISRLAETEQYKGHDHVLRALYQIKQLHPDWKIHYTIQGEGADKDRLAALVQELALETWVEFKGAVNDRNSLTEIYQSSDLFIMPSRFGRWGGRWRGEGFGIVFVEAGVFGVPSIAYNCGGATDIIENDKTGLLVDPDNVEKLASAISRFYENRTLLVSMGKMAHESAKTKFSPSSMVLQLKHFFGKSYAKT